MASMLQLEVKGEEAGGGKLSVQAVPRVMEDSTAGKCSPEESC